MTDTDDKQRPEKQEYRRGLIARFLAVFGVLFPRASGQWIHLTRRFRWIVCLSVLALFGFAASFFVYFSNQPWFCSSCHIMEEYVESWRVSTHKDVNCDQCHYPPGFMNVVRGKMASTSHLIKTLTGTHGSKPHAEVEDASCLREGCHETRLLKGKVLFKKKYRFDHESHLTKLRRGKKLRCTSCHSQMVQGSHITVTESVCFTCHFQGAPHAGVLNPVGGCTSCHDAPAEPIKTSTGITFKHKPFVDRKVDCWRCHYEVVQGTGNVPRQVCITCHREQEKLAKYADPEFIHDWHVTKRKVECFRCHSEIRHGLNLKPQESKGPCAECHRSGHSLQEQMRAGTGGRGVPDSPDRGFLLNVDCVACHDLPDKSTAPAPGKKNVLAHKPTGTACDGCHPKAFRARFTEWKSTLTEMLEETKEELDKAQKACATLGSENPQKAKVESLLEIARHNCNFVATANGVHNINYALDLLDIATESARKAGSLARRSKKKQPPAETE